MQELPWNIVPDLSEPVIIHYNELPCHPYDEMVRIPWNLPVFLAVYGVGARPSGIIV
ncbi:MAG: hypothetical protein M0Q92_01700 [Methanoregula sp.]|nr:hypothetical protein [Methanoregula sp.]